MGWDGMGDGGLTVCRARFDQGPGGRVDIYIGNGWAVGLCGCETVVGAVAGGQLLLLHEPFTAS